MKLIAAWKGAEVFSNFGCDGKTDLVLKIDDQLVQIDVKLAQWKMGGTGGYSWSASGAQKVKPPIYPVIVVPEGDIMNWKVRWINKHGSHGPNCTYNCPPGLEDFWKRPPELDNETTN